MDFSAFGPEAAAWEISATSSPTAADAAEDGGDLDDPFFTTAAELGQYQGSIPVAIVPRSDTEGTLRDRSLPSLAQAALARKLRLEQAVQREPMTFPPESSELCRDGQRCIQSWARGLISGRQCVLRLERCTSVTNMLGPAPDAKDLDELRGSHAALWAVGCPGLGGTDQRLLEIQRSLEGKSPTEVFDDACRAVGRECGMGEEDLQPTELNWEWALQRMARRASRGAKESTGSLQIQIWHELAHAKFSSGSEDALLVGDVFSLGSPTSQHLFTDTSGDAAVLEWLRRTEDEVRAATEGMSPSDLSRVAERLLAHAAQTMQMGARLREVLEDLQRYDAYRILGVKRGASRGEVRRAFYKLALLMHPDKGGDKAAFQELQEAYDEIIRELDANGGNPPADEEAASEGGAEDKERAGGRKRTSKASAKKEAAAGAAAEEGGGGEDAEGAGEGDGQGATRAAASGGGQLGWLTRAALDAAEGAGECATEVLRHCREAREAMGCERQDATPRRQNLPPDLEVGCDHAEVAMVAARALAEAANLIVKLTTRTAEALLPLVPKVDGLFVSDEEIEAAAIVRRAVQDVEDTSQGLRLANLACMRAVDRLSEVLEQVAGGDEDGEEGERADGAASAPLILAAVAALAETAKQLAVAALDAAETAATALGTVRDALGDEMAWVLDEGAPAGEGDGEGEEDAGGPEGAEAQNCEEAPEAPASSRRDKEQEEKALTPEMQHAFEARQALRTLSEALRMLHCSNPEVLRLQQTARQVLGGGAGGADPAQAAERKQRAFLLLVEFLDEAAVVFQRRLKEVMVQLYLAGDPVATQAGVVRAAEECFAFLARSDPALAVPLDPRAQTLRAAVLADVDGVRRIVRDQLSKRLRDSLFAVLLENACDEDTAVDLPDADALQGIVAPALEGLAGLLGLAVDRLADGLRAVQA